MKWQDYVGSVCVARANDERITWQQVLAFAECIFKISEEFYSSGGDGILAVREAMIHEWWTRKGFKEFFVTFNEEERNNKDSFFK